MKVGDMTAYEISKYVKDKGEKFKGKSFEVIQAINAYNKGEITIERLFEISKM